jgi:hypothetical protein
MILEKVYDELSNILTERQFEEADCHAKKEPRDCLVMDGHPETSIDTIPFEVSFFCFISNCFVFFIGLLGMNLFQHKLDLEYTAFF